MTTEITTYSQLNAIINEQYDAIDGDLQETAASSRLQASLQAEINSWEDRTPPDGATEQERAEFFTTKNNALTSLRQQVADLEASQDPNALLDKLTQHLEVVKAAKASYEAYVGAQGAVDTSELSIDQAPLNVGSLDLEGEFNISQLSASDITALITALFRVSASQSSAAAINDPTLGRVAIERHFDFDPITTDTEAGATITAQLQALEWAPPELLELAEYAASVGIKNADLDGRAGLEGRLGRLDSGDVRTAVASAKASQGIEGLDGYTTQEKVAVLQDLLSDYRAGQDPNVTTHSDIPLAVQEAVLTEALSQSGAAGARILEGLEDVKRLNPNAGLELSISYLVGETFDNSFHGGVRLSTLASALGAETPAQIASHNPLTDGDKYSLLLFAADAAPSYNEQEGGSLLEGVPDATLVGLVSEAATRLLGGANPREGDSTEATNRNAELDAARLGRITETLTEQITNTPDAERLVAVFREDFLTTESGAFREDKELDFDRLATLYNSASQDSQLDSLLDSRLSDGRTIRSVLQQSDSAVPYKDSAFWDEVAEELYVSNLSSSLENDVTLTVEAVETREISPEAAQQLMAALAKLLAFLDRAAQRQDERAGELLQFVQTQAGQDRARDLVVALSRVITTSFDVAETIAGNIGPSEEQQRAEAQVQQQRAEAVALETRQAESKRSDALALAAADFVYDPSTVDNSAQAIIAGPGAGRDDVITVRLAQAILEANSEFFEGLTSAAQAGNSTLVESIRTQADANTARDYTPSYI